MNKLLGAAGLVLASSVAVAVGAGAASISGPLSLPGPSCCAAPRVTSEVFDPNNSPVTLTGTVDVSGLPVGSAIFLGLVDKQQYDLPGSTFMGGAYTYISRANSTTLWVGPTDGNLGGEIVQEFDLPMNETVVSFTTVIHAGEISVEWVAGAQSGGPIVDDYGVVKTLNNSGAYAWDEFEFGAYLAIDVFASSTPASVDFSVTAVPEPSTLALLGLGTASLAAARRSRRA